MGGFVELGWSLPNLIAQVINVTILTVLMYVVAYKPVMKLLDERARKVKESMDQAESLKKQAASAEEDIRKQLEAASREGQERIARAAKAGEDVKAKAQEEARQQAELIVVRARSDIQRERDEAIGELRRAFAELTVLAAGKVIDRSLDKTGHRELIDKVLEESSTFKKG